jgi:hypothetical protein
MSFVRFEPQGPVTASDQNRADVACFVGLVRRRRGSVLPREVELWLRRNGWIGGPYDRGDRALLLLRDLPIPIDRWELFDLLFEWESRELDAEGGTAGTYLGAAVRSFFAQGGRKCYVVRVGDPHRYDLPREQRLARLGSLIPGYPTQLDATPVARESWKGIGAIFGLPDVSFLALPDLPELVASAPEPPEPIELPAPPPEQFVECSEETPEPEDVYPLAVRGPHCDEEAFADWATAVRLVTEGVAARAREVQLVAALPILLPARDELLGFLLQSGWLRGTLSDDRATLASSFLQLAYPWLRTPGSLLLPEGIEPPDGALVGVLARNALARGTFRSAAGLRARDVIDVHPELGRHHLERAYGSPEHRDGPPRTLAERVSLFGPTPDGMRLLSDVTATIDESYRPAGINRLVSVLVRTLRQVGEESVFEPNGDALWHSVEERITDVMLGLLLSGALRGATPAEAFTVRCDRTTMSQNDIDGGRIVALVTFRPQAPVERITVVLAMDEGGMVSIAGRAPREAA